MLNFLNSNLIRTLLLLIGTSTLFLSCTEREKPDNLIEEDTYIRLVAELQVAKSTLELSDDSLSSGELIRRVLDRYEVTPSQFVKSHNYYNEDFKAQQNRIEKAYELLQERDIEPVQKDTNARIRNRPR